VHDVIIENGEGGNICFSKYPALCKRGLSALINLTYNREIRTDKEKVCEMIYLSYKIHTYKLSQFI